MISKVLLISAAPLSPTFAKREKAKDYPAEKLYEFEFSGGAHVEAFSTLAPSGVHSVVVQIRDLANGLICYANNSSISCQKL